MLRQAEKAGVKKFVVTSSIVTVAGDPTVKGSAFGPERMSFFFRDRDLTGTEQFTDWNPVTKEEALQTGASNFDIYSAAKKHAELAVWEWAEAHPHVDVTTSQPITLVLPLTFAYKNFPIEQSSPLSSTVHSHPNLFQFRSLILTPLPLFS